MNELYHVYIYSHKYTCKQGDGHIFSIAAASIIAKVTRDRIMLELDKKFPVYGLARFVISLFF